MKQPHVHDNLKFFLSHLSDQVYQKAFWDGGSHPETTVTFGDIRHFLFDDTALNDDSEGCMGVCLRNVEEAKAVRDVAASIETLVAIHGRNLPDAEYVAKPEWQQVLVAAKAALAAVSEPDQNIRAG